MNNLSEPSTEPSPGRSRIDTLVESSSAPDIRRGSPFREGSQATPVMEALPVSLAEWTPESSVTKAAVWASMLVLLFDGTSAVLFPAGGVLTSALGCGLAVAGLFSPRTIVASILLVLHTLLFFRCVSLTL